VANLVIIHATADGFPPTVYSSGDVTVIWVEDAAPDDRFYRIAPTSPPASLIEEIQAAVIGHAGDDPTKHAKAVAAVNAMKGGPQVVVDNDASVMKRAPVQGFSAGIPWAMHLEAYDAYSKKWAPQPALIDLEGKNCRGGFSIGELDDFIPGWRDDPRLTDLL